MGVRGEEWRCMACDTPARFHREGGICPICDLTNDLLDIAAKHPELIPRLRYAAWAIAKKTWALSGRAPIGQEPRTNGQ